MVTKSDKTRRNKQPETTIFLAFTYPDSFIVESLAVLLGKDKSQPYVFTSMLAGKLLQPDPFPCIKKGIIIVDEQLLSGNTPAEKGRQFIQICQRNPGIDFVLQFLNPSYKTNLVLPVNGYESNSLKVLLELVDFLKKKKLINQFSALV